MIRRRASYQLDLRLPCYLVGVCVCLFTGCPHPPKTRGPEEFRQMQQNVKTLEERGITVQLDLLKSGATYFQKFRAGRLPADEAWQRYGVEMFNGSRGTVTCRNHRMAESDLELLAELPALTEFVFHHCTWESEAGKTPEARKSLAGASALSFFETPAPDWVFKAPQSTRLSVSLEATELLPATVATALKNRNVSSLTLRSKDSAAGVFAELRGSGVRQLSAALPVSETELQEILRCTTLTHLTLSAESPIDAKAVSTIAAMDQIQEFKCTLAGDTDFQQVIQEIGPWEYCGLSPADNGVAQFSLSRVPRGETPARWPDDTPAIRAANAAALPAPVSPRLSAPDSNVWIEPLKQRITFSRLRNAKDIRYASSLPDIREVRFHLGNLEVGGNELAEELKSLPHIHTVDLQWKSSRRSDVIAALASLPNLRILKIFSPVKEEFAELQKLTQLQRLEVYEQGTAPGYNAASLPSVPELAMRHYWLPADTLAEFLKVNKSPRVEMVYHNNMSVSSLSAAANSDVQQLVLVPIGPLTSDKIAALRSAFPGYRTEVLKGGGIAHVLSRGG